MNKFHEYIIKDFIKHFCKFKLTNNPIGREYYEVEMYIDMEGDIDDPWSLDVNNFRQDVRKNIFHNITDSDDVFYRSMNKILSGYGLYDEELELVFKLITYELIEMLEEYNSRI